jgi:hypothetical protein
VKRNENKRIRTLIPGRGGWAFVVDDDFPATVFVRLTVTDPGAGQRARFKVSDLVVRAARGDAMVDVAVLRSVPVAWIETEANMPDLFERLMTRYSEHVHLNVAPGEQPSNDDLAVALGLETVTVTVTCSTTWNVAAPVKVRLPKVAGGERYPDSFYQRVADAYLTYLRAGASPAQAIAEDAGAPVTTVHRWIREARRRELLAPARSKGRPG